MRTTITIDDHLLDLAKEHARRRGVTLGRFIEDAVRSQLAERVEHREGPPIPVFRGGDGPRPGVDVTSTRALLEALDEGRTLEELR